MRAKRSKKYRKLMHQYELTFGFREPYQVLVDSNLLRAVHSFKMDLIPALERTLQGKVKPLLTKCSLAAIMASQPLNPRTNNPVRPEHLPPPTTLPLRHCSHNKDSTPIDEASCLLSLLSPTTDVKRNKEHYILATADPASAAAIEKARSTPLEPGKKRKRGPDDGIDELRKAQMLRRAARSIPGVPIVYVKRSVMILEPMSSPSDNIREGVEKDKFRVGLSQKTEGGKVDGASKDKEKKGPKKPKAPNPLSVKKPKKRETQQPAGLKPENSNMDNRDGGPSPNPENLAEDVDALPKAKRRRRHHKSSAKQGDIGDAPVNELAAMGAIDAMSD